MTNIRLPNITGKSEKEQLQQLKSYLYRLVDELNWALKSVNSSNSGIVPYAKNGANVSETEDKNDPVATFNSIKGLIIKSADIVDVYYEEINKRLEGLYVAEAVFPEGSAKYVQQTAADISANADNIGIVYENLQKIDGLYGEFERDIRAYIKTGKLGLREGREVYGIAVGQLTEENGQEVFNQYAWFTADRLSFFDQNGVEVAYVSDRKLYITTAEITILIHGGFTRTAQSNGRVVTKWTGTGG